MALNTWICYRCGDTRHGLCSRVCNGAEHPEPRTAPALPIDWNEWDDQLEPSL